MEVFNVHKVMRSIFKDRISINYKHLSNKIVNYGEGDLKELVKIISNKESKYPFLWLKHDFQTPVPLTKGVTRLDVDLDFLILVDGSKNDLYYKRFEDKYENIIYPIIEAFLEVINLEKGVKVLYDQNDAYSLVSDYPFNDTNSFDLSKDETSAINTVWDATTFPISLRFNPSCFKEVNSCNNKLNKYIINEKIKNNE